MAKTIWKFPFFTTDTVVIEMPIGAEPLAVQVHDDQPCIWALVDPAAEMRRRSFRVYGTGHPVETFGAMEHTSGRYLGTYQEMNGALVWHIFAVGGPV